MKTLERNLRLARIVKKGCAVFDDEHADVLQYSEPDDLDLLALREYDCLILDCGDISSAREVLKRIRAVEAHDIYLKPVYLWSLNEVKDQLLLSIGDGEADPYLRKIAFCAARIAEKSARLEPLKPSSIELGAAIKSMRFLYTRDRTLDPVVDPGSRTGYVYPVVEAVLGAKDEQSVFEVLEFCEKEQLLAGTYTDRVNLCEKCRSSFLNFRETCAKCGSSDITVEDMVHHFTCAYMGPESDFGDGETMVCPKCDKNLKHIGVDYDKPSGVYSCNACGETFQESRIKVLCFHCGSEMPVENLIEKKVKRYRLTSKGELSSIYGINVSMSGIIKFEGMVDIDTFRTFIKYEIQRAKRVARPNCHAYLQFRNFQELYLRGAAREKVFQEIVKLIKESVRPSDVISYLNEATLLFLFTDTSLEGARVPIDRLRVNLVKLIEDNFNGFSPEIHAGIGPIDGNTDPDRLLDGVPGI